MKRRIAALLLIALLAPSPASALARIVKPGDVIDQPGVFIPADDMIKAAKLLERIENFQEQIAALDTLAQQQTEQVKLLEDMQASSDREIALKDLIIQHKDEMLAFRKEINDEYKNLLAESRKTLDTDKTTIERLEKRIESLEKKSIWMTILGGLLGAAVAYFTFGILH